MSRRRTEYIIKVHCLVLIGLVLSRLTGTLAAGGCRPIAETMNHHAHESMPHNSHSKPLPIANLQTLRLANIHKHTDLCGRPRGINSPARGLGSFRSESVRPHGLRSRTAVTAICQILYQSHQSPTVAPRPSVAAAADRRRS